MPSQKNGGAVAGIRLTDIKIEIRRRHGRVLLDRAIKELDAMQALEFASELHRAVEQPSDKTYWLPLAVVDAAKEKWAHG